MLVLIYSLVGIAAATTAISLIGPNVDLAIAGLFFDPATAGFPAGSNRHVGMMRDHGTIAVVTCIACVVLALAKFLPWRVPSVPGRAAVFLTISMLLGPGLLVNVILKDHWDRPRPVHVDRFGGTKTYVDWWNPTGSCDKNCSFVSGEAATAAWMFGPAMLLPAPWRAAAIGAAAVFTAAMAGLRMAVGAHFFTDVLFGVLSTILILLVMHRLIFRWPRPAFGRTEVQRADPGVRPSN